MAAAFVKTAEHFVIFRTKYLDTYDQSFEAADKQVAEDHTNPVGVSALCACKLQDNFHDSGMADCKCADTDK